MGYMTTYTLKARPVDEKLYERIDDVLRTFNNWLESEGVETGMTKMTPGMTMRRTC